MINQLNNKLKEKEKIIQNLQESITQEINVNKELNKNFDIKIKKIKDMAKEIENLKKNLNKYNEKIQKLNEKIKKISKKDKVIESLLEKEKEIKELKSKIQNYKFELKGEEKLVNLIFMSSDESIIYSSMCKNSDKFIDIEKNLYKNFPELLQSENDFYRKGSKINKYNSMDENKIKDGDILIFNIKKNI